MGDVGLLDPPRRAAENGNGAARHLARRRGLPNGRALAGGLLVSLAALGIFAAYRGAAAGPSGAYVVARHDLTVGSRIGPDDVAVIRMDLPPGVRRGAFTRVGGVLGATVVGPLADGELVQASDLVRRDGAPGAQELSFSIEPARALDGRIVPGESIDLLATYGGGGDSYTTVVARRVLVADVSGGGDSFARGRNIVLTLSLDRAVDVLAVTHAARSGNLTVARSGADDAGPTVYRPSASRPTP
jgi:Flp pilus assembly protein CpaB